MIQIGYQRLFNLKIAHDYYADGLAKGVVLTPTQETVKLLKDGQMVLKKLAHQMVVLYRGLNEVPPVNPPNPFVDLGKDFKFTFSLKVGSKSEFLNITNFDAGADIYQSGMILYFKNIPANASPEQITHTLIDSLRNSLFTYQFLLATGTGDVDIILLRINNDGSEIKVPSGKDTQGQNLPLNFKLEQFTDGSYSHSVNLRDLPFGRYKIKITAVGNEADVKKEERIYVHDELARQDILGIVDVIYDTAQSKAYDVTEEYNIQFFRQKAFWKYFLIPKVGVAPATYTITDVIGASGPYVANTFVAKTDKLVNGKTAKVFISNDKIVFYEKPKPKIELKEGAKIRIANLPNASPRNILKMNTTTSELESEIYVFL